MKLFKNLYLHKNFYIVLSGNIFLFLLGFAFSSFFIVAKVSLLVVFLLFLIDILMLFGKKDMVAAQRNAPEKLSNGDQNNINLLIQNYYGFDIEAEVIDEVPHQFQWRNASLLTRIKSGDAATVGYQLRPTQRGEYEFGAIHVFVSATIKLAIRRFTFDSQKNVPVYPSYLQMRKYELLAISNRLTEIGIKKIRKIGHNMEFDQIREYVIGDDYRSVNWKATARRNTLMVNQFQDERSQQVYSIIEKGRAMQMPFEGLTLLDYAINAALVISNIAIIKQDKAGLISFCKTPDTFLKASNVGGQMNKILEALYRDKTDFKEADYEQVYISIRRNINQRSLLLFFTNFETLHSMERQLTYLKSLAKQHLVVVIFFENTELKNLLESEPKSTEDIYLKTIGEKFAYEKRQIVKELEKNGIHTILSKPQELTINTLNKYLELKARGMI